MADKKTIPNAVKSTSNIKDDFGDFGSLDDWESDLENFSFEDSGNLNDRKPKGVIREGVTEAFKSALKSLGPSILRKTREKVKSVDSLLNDGESLVDETKYLKEQFAQDITPTLNTLKQTGRTLNSKLKGNLPDTLTDKLEKLFKEEEQELPTRELTKEEIENNTIKESLNAVFLEQAKHQDEKEKKESQDKFLERSLTKYRHDQISQLLNQIRINTTSERLFIKSTYTSYLKKDLELKYKHLFVSKEILATQQASAKLFESQLNTLIKNSTLPDIQKKRLSESAKEMVLNSIGSNFANYGTNVLQRLIQNVKNKSKDFTSQANMLTSMLGMVTDMAGMGMSPASMVGSMVGEGISDKISSWLSDKLFGDGLSDGTLKGNKKALELAGSSLQARLSNRIRKMKLGDSIFSALLPDDQRTTSVTNKNALDPNKDASWDNASRTSLVYIIPQYLARILQQTTNIATGTQNPLLLYSPVQNKLVEQRQLQKDFTVNMLGNDRSRGERTGRLIGSLKAAYRKTNRTSEAKTDEIFKDNDILLKQVLYNADRYKVYPDEQLLRDYLNVEEKYDELSIAKQSEVESLLDKTLFSGIDNDEDREKIAKLLLRTTSGSKKNKLTTLVKQNVDVAYSDYLSNIRDLSQETLEKFSSYGFRDELGKLVDKKTSSSVLSIDEDSYREAFINAGVKNGGLDSGILEGRANVYQSISDIQKYRRNESRLANAVFDYLAGDFTSGNEQVVFLAKDINKILLEKGINLKDSKTILPGLKTIVLEGIDQGIVSVSSFIDWLKTSDKKELLNLKKHYGNIKKWFNNKFQESNEKSKKLEEERKEREKKLREYYNSLDTGQDAYEFLYEDSINSPINVTAKTNTLSPISKPVQQTSSEKIVDAIKHFEGTFISYVDWQQTHQPTITDTYIQDYQDRGISSTDTSNKTTTRSSKTKTSKQKNKTPLFSGFISSLEQKKQKFINKFNTFKESIKNKEWFERLSKDTSIPIRVYNNIISGKVDKDPLIREVQKTFEDLKDDPELLKEKLNNLNSEFKNSYNDFITRHNAFNYSSAFGMGEKISKGFDKVGGFAKDILSGEEYEKARKKVDDIKVNLRKAYEQDKEETKSTYGSFKSRIKKTARRLIRPKYVDIYPKEILQDPSVPPLVTASQLERGDCVFADGKVVPDSYSIDRRVYDKNYKNVLIDDHHISNGIYNIDGEEITKKSFAYRAGQAARKATEFTFHNSLKLAGAGIKLGMKSLLFGMGLYGKMYWMMGKLGFNIAKGMAKGIFNLKTARLMGKGVLGLAKGVFTGLRLANLLGTRALWSIGRGIGGLLGIKKTSKFMRGPEQSVFSKFLNISGITKAKDATTGFMKEKFDTVKGAATTAKNKVSGAYRTAKDFVLGDENEDGTRSGGLVDDIKNVKRNITGDEETESLYSRAKNSVHDFFTPINEESKEEDTKDIKDDVTIEEPIQQEQYTSDKENTKKKNRRRKRRDVRDSRAYEKEEKIQGTNEIFNDTLDSSVTKKKETKPTVTSYFDQKTPAERSADALEKLTEINKKDNKKGFFSKILSLLTGGFGILGALAKGLASLFGFDDLIDSALGAASIAKGVWNFAKKGVGLVKKGAGAVAKGASTVAKKVAPSALKQVAKKAGSKLALSGLAAAGLGGLSTLLAPVLSIWGIVEGVDFLVEMYESYAKEKENLLTADKINENLEKNPASTTTGEQIDNVNDLITAAENGSLETLNFKKNDAGNYVNSNSGWAYNSNMSGTERINQYNRTTARNAGIDTTISDTTANIKPMKFTPDPNELGALSAKYESNGKPDAIGYDRTGGTSYGRFQIASQVGTFNNFVNWCEKNGGSVGKEVAQRLKAAWSKSNSGGKFGNTGGRTGAIVLEWKKLASEGKIAPLEYAFIKATHYDKGLKNIKTPEVKQAIDENRILQEVLWSTSVQHGPGAISGIFDKAWKSSNGNLEQFVKNIYDIRGTKFGRSTPKVRASVHNRFRNELATALDQLKKGGGNPIVTTEQSTNALNPNASVSENTKEMINATGETLTSSAPQVSSTTETNSTSTGTTTSTPSTESTSSTNTTTASSSTTETTTSAAPTVTTPSIQNTTNSPEIKVNTPALVESTQTKPKESTTDTTKNTYLDTNKTNSTNPVLDILRQVVPLLETINTSIGGVTKAVTSSSMEMTKIFMGNMPSSSSSSPISSTSKNKSTQKSYSSIPQTPKAQINVAKAV